MKTSINQSQFANNQTIRDNFSYEGACALFNYLEEYESDTGEELDFDPVAIRCEFIEYSNLDDITAAYLDLEDCEKDSEKIEWLCEQTIVIVFNHGFIIQDF